MNTIVKDYDKQTFIQYANAICEGYKTIKDIYNVICHVGSKMNGKVLNKRFSTAIEDKLKELNINALVSLNDQFNMGYRDLTIYLQDRSIKVGQTWVYFDENLNYKKIHNADKTFCENNRIIFAKIEDYCKDTISRCDKEIAKWSDAATNYDKYKTAIENAVKEFGKAVKNINSLFVPYEIHSYDWN